MKSVIDVIRFILGSNEVSFSIRLNIRAQKLRLYDNQQIPAFSVDIKSETTSRAGDLGKAFRRDRRHALLVIADL